MDFDPLRLADLSEAIEADAKKGMISVTSPVARALMGKEVGDDVQVKVPKGTREFEVLEIRVDAA